MVDSESAIRGLAIAKKKGIPVKLLLVERAYSLIMPKTVTDCIQHENLYNETTWLDFVPYDEVPQYISGIDVGLIPFNIFNPTAFYAAPNKMWEYLSQKPVISSPIPETLANLDSVLLSITAEDYAKTFDQVSQQKASVLETVDNGYNKATRNTLGLLSRTFNALLHALIKK